MIFILLYIIPIVIILFICYIDMKKGESVEEYCIRNNVDGFLLTLLLIPFVNIIVSSIIIATVTINKIKHLRK